MRKVIGILCASGVMALLAGCSTSSNNSVNTSTQTGTGTADQAAVSLSMTDDPPAGVDVLFFQVSLTAAALQPSDSTAAAVSLLNNNTPVQIDVTQLQTLSAFLSTANVAGGTYSSLSLTFGSPQLVIFNQSDTALGSTCAVGSVCTLTPTVDNSATVSFTTTPFPVTVSAGSPLGFLVDFHLNTVIQSDLSVNLGVTNGITVKQLPPPSTPVPPQFGYVSGTVGAPDTTNNTFPLVTRDGRTFTIDTSGSTTYSNFPASACSTAGFGCLAQGQVVQVQVTSFAMGGVLTAGTVTYVQSASQQTVEGTIIGILPLPTPAGEEIVQVLLHFSPTATSSLPLGGVATVTLASTATYSIDDSGFTMPAGDVFTGPTDVTVGQTVQLMVAPGTLGAASAPSFMGGWGPPQTVAFTASSVELEPSQMSGMITTLDSTTNSFALGFNFSFFPWPNAGALTAVLANVQTTSQTTYNGFSPESFSGLATNDVVSVSGWIFPAATAGTAPTMVAQSVMLRPNAMF